MRTTLDIDPDVLLAAKELARRDRRSVGKAISDLARQSLTRSAPQTATRTPSTAQRLARLGIHVLPHRGGIVTEAQLPTGSVTKKGSEAAASGASDGALLRSLLDVNVLIALHDPQHVHHGLAASWFEAEGHLAWASSPITQNGCLRVMCQPSYTHPWTLRELAPVLTASFSARQHAFWPDDIGLLDTGRLRLDHVHGHRQLTDLYLLMLAVQHRGRFVTFDARVPLSAVAGAAPRHLLSLIDAGR